MDREIDIPKSIDFANIARNDFAIVDTVKQKRIGTTRDDHEIDFGSKKHVRGEQRRHDPASEKPCSSRDERTRASKRAEIDFAAPHRFRNVSCGEAPRVGRTRARNLGQGLKLSQDQVSCTFDRLSLCLSGKLKIERAYAHTRSIKEA